MTEKERMLSGHTYNSRDPELLNRYHRVRNILTSYNQTSSENIQEKRKTLVSLFGSMGEGVWIEAPFYCDYGEHIYIGDDTFINYNCVFLDSNQITIGRNVLIGPGVQIYTATHPLSANERLLKNPDNGKSRTRYLTKSKPVTVSDNTWIGGGALIMPGITIGENSSIGAGSVVTKPIPPNCFAAGNPCKIIKRLQH
jgi:maltose O-acetyltransferase